MNKVIVGLMAILLLGCVSSGPEKTLESLAKALSTKDSALFLAQLDMPRFAAAHMRNITEENPALRTLDSMGQMLGMGAVSGMLGDLVDTQGSLTAEFKRGVGTGELALACKDSLTPQCPWVADSLRAAKIKELNPTAAVARVTTPANISSWLALSKVGDAWLVVGHAPLEDQAARYAVVASAPKSLPGSGPAVQGGRQQGPQGQQGQQGQQGGQQGQQRPEKPEAPTQL